VNAYVEPVVSLDLDVVAAVDDIGTICRVSGERGLMVEEFEHSVNISSMNSDLRIQSRPISATKVLFQLQRIGMCWAIR